jgi:hypothetical protein
MATHPQPLSDLIPHHITQLPAADVSPPVAPARDANGRRLNDIEIHTTRIKLLYPDAPSSWMSMDLQGQCPYLEIPVNNTIVMTKKQVDGFFSFRNAVRGCMVHGGRRDVYALIHQLNCNERFMVDRLLSDADRFQTAAGMQVVLLVKNFSQKLCQTLAPCFPNLTPQVVEIIMNLVDRMCESLFEFDVEMSHLGDDRSFSDELENAKAALLPLRRNYLAIHQIVCISSALNTYECPTHDVRDHGANFTTFIETLLPLVHLAERYVDVATGWGIGMMTDDK